MKVDQRVAFPYSRRKSVRTIASDLKLDKGMTFKSNRDEKDENILIVVRTN